jgi:hypothetical protein
MQDMSPLKGILSEGLDWILLIQDRVQQRAVVSTVMNLRLQYKAGRFLVSCVTVSFSRRADT